MIGLDDLTRWLHRRLGDAAVYRHALDRPELDQATPGPPTINRLLLALEPDELPPTLDVSDGHTALFLHRAYRIGEAWAALPVLNSHDGFDAALTTGPNERLAAALRWREVQRVDFPRAAGLSALPPQQDWARLLAALDAEVGGHDTALPPREGTVQRVAVMNAMRPELLEAVAAQGVNVYLTGQMRPSALNAARTLGVGVVALGHRRTELWGLRQLARELEVAFPGLETRVYGRA